MGGSSVSGVYAETKLDRKLTAIIFEGENGDP